MALLFKQSKQLEAKIDDEKREALGLPPWRGDNLADYSVDEQTEILRVALAELRACTNQPITAERAKATHGEKAPEQEEEDPATEESTVDEPAESTSPS